MKQRNKYYYCPDVLSGRTYKTIPSLIADLNSAYLYPHDIIGLRVSRFINGVTDQLFLIDYVEDTYTLVPISFYLDSYVSKI